MHDFAISIRDSDQAVPPPTAHPTPVIGGWIPDHDLVAYTFRVAAILMKSEWVMEVTDTYLTSRGSEVSQVKSWSR